MLSWNYSSFNDVILPDFETTMNRNSYEDLYDDGPDNRQKPHAQIHLLSPTDKCKVEKTFNFE